MVRNTRRDFLKTVAAGPLAAGVLRPGAARAQAAIAGPGEVPITLTVNNERYLLAAEPRTTLLDVLRLRLDLTGTKRACDRGVCGACTVLIGGRTYYSCSLLAIEAQGQNVRTVEGIVGHAGALHPLQQALCDHDGLMCGFCTPGVVMTSVALLETTPAPTPGQARRALDGNLCRCGANVGILRAVIRG
jgi:aerobic-type carbon monoxide dehydrogenase small subunit (CoxS/CutS family)